MLRAAPGDGDATTRWRQADLAAPEVLSVWAYPQLEQTGSLALLYGVQDARNHYRAELYPRAGVARILRILDGTEGVISEATNLQIPTGQWLILNVTWERGVHTFNFGSAEMAPKHENQAQGREDTWARGGYGLRVTGPGTVTFDRLFTTP
jgi:hypothetical protein